MNLLVYLVCCFFLSKRDYLFLKDIYFHFFKYFAFETASQIWCRHFSWWLPPPRKNVMDAVDLKKWCVDYAKMYVCNSNFLMPLVFCCCQSSIIQLYSFIFSSLRLCVCVSRSAGSITIEKTIFFFLFPTVCDPFINRTYLYTQQMEKRDFFFPCYYWSTNRIRFPSVGFQKGTRPFSRWMTHQARYTSEESVCNLLLCVLTQTNPNRDGLVTPNLSSNSIWHFFFFLFDLAGLNQ